jgi:hypothetical protein
MPQVIECHRRQAEMLGVEMDLPEFFDSEGNLKKPLTLALAIERGGQVTNVLSFELMVEMSMLGTDVVGTEAAFSPEVVKALKWHFRQKKARHIRSFVDRRVENPIGKRLQRRAGFTKLDDQYSHYALDLDEGVEGGKERSKDR